MADKEEQEPTPAQDIVVTKYKMAGDMVNGIAFPTCVSVNNCICHFSPLKSEPDVILKDGDVVKVDLGAQIDGFIAVAAHTLVIGASANSI
ncbi:hypothetical protein KUTeg_014971 [Tegillarca granosa]|uniref:Peptidase M24 domain-containing protein n=1 Tax=Tegillarca granosa TaxID=220873 RepID=A0ABQ9ESF4_TEGGR|nr:hypothetical protein KUTeg_014971 [Tegillarca granosa]